MTTPQPDPADPATQSGVSPHLGWAIAIMLAVLALVMAARYFAAKAENGMLRQQNAMAEIALKSAHTQIEAERILAARFSADYNALKSGTQVNGSAGTDTHAKNGTALDRIRATLLRPGNSATDAASAVAVWDPATRHGLLIADGLKAGSPEAHYELWIGGGGGEPTQAVSFSVDAHGRARVKFDVGTATPAIFQVTQSTGAAAQAAPRRPGEVILSGRAGE